MKSCIGKDHDINRIRHQAMNLGLEVSWEPGVSIIIRYPDGDEIYRALRNPHSNCWLVRYDPECFAGGV